jgi:hypothetical protein
MPKSYRIKATPGVDKHIDIKLEQDFEFLEILSLKILQSEIYTRVCSDYGVIVGRVSVNNGFGLPNAKVSVFIPLSDEDNQNPIISELYPYQTLTDRDEQGYRYNLLPKSPSYTNHSATGSFPDKDEVLLNQSWVEVYDKYYKFTVKTNDSGDYMIFGVPTGSQTLVMDVDLSDIGCFSLTPQDLIRTGNAVENDFNGSNYKTSSNLDELPQIINFNRIIDVSPLWGDTNICQLGINRVDFDLTKEYNIKINPVSVFLGSIMSNTDENAQKINCKPQKDTGKFCELIAGPGQILSIRQTINLDNQGLPILEEYKLINEGRVIDENGAFVVDVPMNLDYVTTNEFGEQVLSSNPNVGIPTKGKYRFKIKWQNENGNANDVIRANFLVPNVKEYGWSASNNDPYDYPQFQVFYVGVGGSITAGLTTYSETMTFNGGLSLLELINAENLSLTINSIPYAGTLESINVNIGDVFQWSFTPIDTTQNVIIKFQFYPQDYFDLLKSYAFSLEWDDYVNPVEAINCDDTFYQFNYNKVYTTAMFLDRYKFGAARWTHLGIKEIDDRTCRTENNIYPVNDIIRNQDLWFQLLTFLLNILTFPIMALIVATHLVYTFWPLVKALILFGIIITGYFIVQYAINLGGAISFITSLSVSINIWGYILIGLVYTGLLALLGLLGYMTYLFFRYIVPLKRVPISLPLLSYPECTNCECSCTEPEVDDITQSDIEQFITNSYADNQIVIPGIGATDVTSISNSLLAPINQASNYVPEHPNFSQRPGFSPTDANGGWFYNGGEYKSLTYSVNDNELDTTNVVRATVDFRRLFTGSDLIVGSSIQKLHAPQPFLFAADKSPGNDERWFGFPTDVTYSQKLNEFNSRDKYFNNASPLGSLNRITTTVNPSLGSDSFDDQILVILAKPGTTGQLIDQLVSFQNPLTSPAYVNITGATENQFLTNSITGTTTTGTTPLVKFVNYANPTDSSGVLELTAQIKINQTTNNGEFKYPNDIEYFQVITGLTVSQFLTQSNGTNNPQLFHQEYLRHKINYVIARALEVSSNNTSNYPFTTGPSVETFFYTDPGTGVSHTRQIGNYDSLTSFTNFNTYEILFLTRGVDPYTDKQEIKYDLSRIFGFTTPDSVTFTGLKYLNIPIRGTNSFKPKSHNTIDNSDNRLYYPSYTFTVTSPYTAFTSFNPYYYLSTDDTTLNSTGGGLPGPGGANYRPNVNLPILSTLSNMTNLFSGDRTLPNYNTSYIGGTSFIASKFNNLNITNWSTFADPYFIDRVGNPSVYGYPEELDPTQDIYSVYSPAYYRYTASTTNPLVGVDFNNSSRLVMRSDRLPTSDKTQESELGTGFALHQNDNFAIYVNIGPVVNIPLSTGPQEITGESADEDEMLTGITQSLECDNMVPLSCYQGTGLNLGIDQDCVDDNKKRFVKGCYCFPTKKLGIYILGIPGDIQYFLEWKTRFTVLYAACRGIFSQTFQNNWINGNLYMFSIKKGNRYFLNPLSNAAFDFCDHNVIYNEISDNFYYRSSPWDSTFNLFIGAERPNGSTFGGVFIGSGGFNDKQIQFPTTIMDLGPRDKFINEICGDSNLQGYFIDQVKSTSYSDTSDIVKLGFLSRLINSNFLEQMTATYTSSGLFSEGVGINQFFNSTRGGYRIDGDFAQALSINSEFKVISFATDTYPNNFIYVGEDNNTPFGRGLFGIFYSSSTEDVKYRRRYSPGSETFNQSPLIQYNYGYPNTQNVPHYRWKLKSNSNVIFGTEDNNWNTTPDQFNGFYAKGYQDLNYLTDPYFKILGGTNTGYITKFNAAGVPVDSNFGVSPGLPPSSGPVVGDLAHNIVGAPYHFYFGLNNGKTAINRYIQIYLNLE